MRIMSKIIVGIIILAVLLGVGAGILLATFNPNNYKEQIATLIQNKTGRTLTFGGDIKIVFYPILGFKADQVSLGNPRGFSSEDFLQIHQVELGVKLIPLLHRQIELTTLRLLAPTINLIKRKDGHTNWEQTTQNENAKFIAPPATPGTKKEATAQQLAALQIEKLEISDASLNYQDQLSGKKINVQPFNLKLGNFRFGQNAPLALDFILHSGAPPQTVKVKLGGKVNADPATGKYQIAQLQTGIDVQPSQGAAIHIDVSGDAAVDQKTQAISVTDLHATGGGLNISGQAHIQGFSTPAIDFTLNAPSIDLTKLPTSTASTSSPSTAITNTSVKENPADTNKPLLPLALLRTLKIGGRLTVGSLKAAKLTLSNIKTTFAAHNGIITVDPLNFDFYKGHVEASLKLDARTDTPPMAVKGQVQNLNIGELLQAQMGKDYVTGQENSKFDLTSNGNTLRALQSNSGGTFNFAVTQGTINKWKLSERINQAEAFIKNGQTTQATSDQLSFSSLSGSFTGKNGDFSNSDLQMIGPQVHATGSGSVDLRQQKIDYTLNVGTGIDPTKFAKAKTIPVRITGPLTNPNYAVDLQAMITEFAGKKVDKVLSKLTGDKSLSGNKNVKNLLKGFLGGAQ